MYMTGAWLIGSALDTLDAGILPLSATSINSASTGTVPSFDVALIVDATPNGHLV